MVIRILVGVGLSTLLLTCGCGALLGLLGPTTTNVRLVNNGQFPVECTVTFSDEQTIPENLLTAVGTELQFTMAAGQVASFSRDCGDLQALIVADADLQIIGSVGPSTQSGVLRDGSDFNCGDTITFTFSHSVILIDFAVSSGVQ